MNIDLGGVAFFCLIAAQFAAVVALHDARWEVRARETQDRDCDLRVRPLWTCGS